MTRPGPGLRTIIHWMARPTADGCLDPVGVSVDAIHTASRQPLLFAIRVEEADRVQRPSIHTRGRPASGSRRSRSQRVRYRPGRRGTFTESGVSLTDAAAPAARTTAGQKLSDAFWPLAILGGTTAGHDRGNRLHQTGCGADCQSWRCRPSTACPLARVPTTRASPRLV